MTQRTPISTRKPPRGGIPPWQPLTLFFVVLGLVYVVIFFTGGGSPKPLLGIDLQGGTRVTLEARTDDGRPPSQDQLNQARQIINNRVNGLGVSGSEVVVSGNNLVITVPGTDGAQARALGQTARLYVRPVIQQVPATEQPAVPEPENPPTPDEQKQAIEEARAKRQATTDDFGKRQPELIAAMATLDCSPDAKDPLVGHDKPDEYLVACGADDNQVYLLAPMIVDGRDVDKASATLNDAGQNVVSVEYKGTGREAWATFTQQNNGATTAVVLDSRVVSAARINNPYGERFYRTEISGDFTKSEAENLANSLKYGSLPLSFEAQEAVTISATQGSESLRAALIAGLIGMIAVLLYAMAYYRMLGLLAVFSILLAAAMVYGWMVLLGRWIGFTLDLAGIAGLIIGIGMTADSFVVYFERIKDEVREGRSFRSAVPRGWASARRTIWTGNAVSFIASVVIYILAVGEVKGFAFTLGLTTIVDVMVVFLVTHPLVVYASRSSFLSKPKVVGLGAVTEVGRRRREAGAVRAVAARRAAATEVVEKPTQVVDKPTAVVDTPTQVIDTPTEVVEKPAPAVDPPIRRSRHGKSDSEEEK